MQRERRWPVERDALDVVWEAAGRVSAVVGLLGLDEVYPEFHVPAGYRLAVGPLRRVERDLYGSVAVLIDRGLSKAQGGVQRHGAGLPEPVQGLPEQVLQVVDVVRQVPRRREEREDVIRG